MQKTILILCIIVQSFALSKEQILKIYNGNKNVPFLIELTSKDVLDKAYFSVEKNYRGKFLRIERKGILLSVNVEDVLNIIPISTDLKVFKNRDLIFGKTVRKKNSFIEIYHKTFGRIKIKNRYISHSYENRIPFRNKIYPTEIVNYSEKIKIKSSLLQGIQDLDYIKGLNIIVDSKIDFKILNKISGLRMLKLSKFQGVLDCGEITSLEELDLSSNKITEIKNLQNLLNLKKLDLNNNKFTGTLDLGVSKNLEDLNLRDNKINKVKNLESCLNLRYLYLSYNQFEELPNLSNLKKLEYLDVEQNNIKTIKNISNLPKLKNIELSYNKLADKLILENLPSLIYINLSNNKLNEVSLKDNCKNLISIEINNNQLKEIKFNDPLPNLTRVEINNNQLKEIEFNYPLPKLTHLKLNFNKLENISGLENMQNLIGLFANTNKLSKLENMSSLSKLVTLNIRNNNFTELNNLRELSKLTGLNISFNKLKDISFAKNLINLRNLSFNTNEIKDITVLENCPKLVSLNISNNPIESIDVIKHFDNLRILVLVNTLVKDISLAKKVNNLLNTLGTKVTTDDLSLFSCKILMTDSPNITKLPKKIDRFYFDFNNKVHLKYAIDNKIKNLSFASFKGDFSFLTELAPCEMLNFSNTNFNDLTLLKKHKTSLRKLYLVNCKIDDLSFLSDFKGTIYVAKEDYSKLIKTYPDLNFYSIEYF